MPQTSYESYTRTVQISAALNSASSSTPKLIYQPGLLLPSDRATGIRYAGFLVDLRAYIEINSIEEVPLPDIELTATRTQKINAMRGYEWEVPRKQVTLQMQVGSEPSIVLAQITLPRRDPYYHKDVKKFLTEGLSFPIGPDTKLWATVDNVGYGLLQGNDKVNFFGAVREEAITLPESSNQIVDIENSVSTINNTGVQLAAPNPFRKSLVVVNNTSFAEINQADYASRIMYLGLGRIPAEGEGIPLYPNGGSYEINNLNLFRGSIFARSLAQTIANVSEGS